MTAYLSKSPRWGTDRATNQDGQFRQARSILNAFLTANPHRRCSMNTSSLPIAFAGSTLGRYRHICAFFNSPQEEYETLLPFVREGIERGERAFHVLPVQYR